MTACVTKATDRVVRMEGGVSEAVELKMYPGTMVESNHFLVFFEGWSGAVENNGSS